MTFLMSIDPNDEKKLLLQIANGDEQAFNILYKRYWDRLYNYLLRVTKSHEASEDIAIDIFTKLWVKRDMLPDIRNMNAFLFKMAYNKTMDFFKHVARNTRMQEIIAGQIPHPEGQADHCSSPAADSPLLNKESQDILHELISELPPQRRLIFTLSKIDGLSQKEIAKELGLSVNTIKTSMANAKKSVRLSLKKKYPENYPD